MKIVPLDTKATLGRSGPGVAVPLHPFFGSMGVASPPSFGRYDSAQPMIEGSSMDGNALVADTTPYLPLNAE